MNFKLPENITVENVVYTLIAFFVCLLIFNLPTFKNKIIAFFLNTLIAVGLTYFVGDLVPIPDMFLLSAVIASLVISLLITLFSNDEAPTKATGENGVIPFVLKSDKGNLIFNNPFRNFMAIGGANAGKTKSVGKPLLENYVKNNFAMFVYDLKDYDYTRSVYNLINKYQYPYKFYYINFVDISRTYRTNILDPKLIDENLMLQLISDILGAYLGDGRKDEWYINALGIFKGVAMRFYYDFPQHCNLPTITNFCVHNDAKRITEFLKERAECVSLASGFIASEESVKTQASILSSLTGRIGDLAFNKKVCYVLSGNDFDFNIIDKDDPKCVCVSNNFAMQDLLGPVVALMVKVLSRHFTLNNKINTAFVLDEATTFKIDGFENMPSVLREYKASFLMLTQSTAKIEKVYGKLDKASLQANFGNVFYGAISETNDIKDFSILFTRKMEERKTRTRGSSGNRGSRSMSVSTQDKDRYEPAFFKNLKAGEFVGVTSDSNKREFHVRFKLYEHSQEEQDMELPIVRTITDSELRKHYDAIVSLVKGL